MTENPANAAPLPKARVIVEAKEDGGFVMEYYINGSRQREVLPPGDELYIIKTTLRSIERKIKADVERKRELKANEENIRHRRVWSITAEDHGIAFANRTIGPKNAKAMPKVPTVATSLDLLD